MLPKPFQNWARGVAEGIVRPLARLGITPNAVTIVGFFFNVVTAAILASGHLSAGAIMLLFSGAFDMLDGALARVTQEKTVFGAFLDSVLDRYSEIAILLGLLYAFLVGHHTIPALLVFLTMSGSLMISYTRARAEGLGLEAKVGILPRPERVIILGLGLLFTENTTIAALVLLSILTNVTAFQRLYHVWHVTRHQAEEAHPAQPKKREPAPGRAVD